MHSLRSTCVFHLALLLLGLSAGLALAHLGAGDHGESCAVCTLAHTAFAELAPGPASPAAVTVALAGNAPAELPTTPGNPLPASPRAPPRS